MTRRLLAPAVIGLAVLLPAPALGAAAGDSQSSSSGSPVGRVGDTLVLARGAGFDSWHGASLVRITQRRLAQAGYAPGPIDGRYGPLTLGAVVAFQRSHGLQVDGIVGPRTLAALTRSTVVLGLGAGDPPRGSELVRTLQRRLALAGYPPGPIDGRYGPLTTNAVRRFQATHDLSPSGTADPRTLSRVAGQARHARASSGKLSSRSQRSSGAPTRKSQRIAQQPGSPVSPTHNAVRQIRQRPTPSTVRQQAPHRGGAATAWLVIFIAFGFALILTAFTLARRGRRHRVSAAAPPPPAPASHRADGSPPVERDADRGKRAFDLGLELEQQGNLVGAQAAFRRADENGHGTAASHLGALLEEQGALAEAEAAYRRADQRGDAAGAFRLGVMLVDRGELAEAEDACRRADDRGHAGGASNLGVLLEERGVPAEAEAAYRRADQRGDAAGAFNLAVLLEERGALAEAEAAYRRADQRGDGEVAEMAQAALADLARRTRELSPTGSA